MEQSADSQCGAGFLPSPLLCGAQGDVKRYLLYLQALPESQSFTLDGQGFELDPRGPKCISDDAGLGPQLKALCKLLSYTALVSAIEKIVAK
jgi:hypothetical protein